MKDLHLQPNDERLVTMLRALGNPARVMIVKALRERGPSQTGALLESLPLSQSTISEHLRRLKEAGVISCELDGACVTYHVNEAALTWLRGQLMFETMSAIQA